MLRNLAAAWTALLLLGGAAVAAEPVETARADGRFVPKEQRAPVSYESVTDGIYFKTLVAGREARAVLDCGAGVSLLDVEFARGAGLGIESPAPGVNRALDVSLVIPGQFEVKLPKLRAADLHAMTANADMPRVDLVLGAEFLKWFLVAVDPRSKTFKLAPSGAFIPPPGLGAIELHGGMPQAEVSVGKEKALVLLQLGNNAPLALAPAAWKRLAPGSLESIPGKQAVLPEVQLGSVTLTDVPLRESPATGALDGMLGMGVLGKFQVFLDISAGKMWLASAAPASATPAASTPPATPGEPAKSAGGFVPREQRAPVTFESPNGEIFFRANIAGRDVWAIVDTGSTYSAMEIELARNAGLAIGTEEITGKTPRGEVKAKLASDVVIKVPGQIESRRAQLPAMDLGPLSRVIGRKIEFVLGEDFLRKLVFVVEPNRKTFWFLPGGMFKAPPGAQQIALSDASPPQIEVKIGNESAVVLVDTGFNGQLLLTPEAWARMVPKDAAAGTSLSTGAEGRTFAARSASVAKVRIGGIEVADVKVDEGPARSGDGRIGMAMLRKFPFALDISTNSLWLGQAPATASSPIR